MTTYMQRIEATPIVKDVEVTLTTGDLDYDGTALEVSDESGNELFHVVVDSNGERQFSIRKQLSNSSRDYGENCSCSKGQGENG